MKLSEKKEAIKQLVEAWEQVGRTVPFSLLVEAVTDHQVIPLDLENDVDREVIDALYDVTNSLVQQSQTEGGLELEDQDNVRTRVSAWAGYEILEGLKERGYFQDITSTWSGYPRIHFRDSIGRGVFLSIKTMDLQRQRESSGLRTLYLSPQGMEIENDGLHLAITLTHSVLPSETDEPKTVVFSEFSIRDLSSMLVNTKVEFSGTGRQLMETKVMKTGEA